MSFERFNIHKLRAKRDRQLAICRDALNVNEIGRILSDVVFSNDADFIRRQDSAVVLAVAEMARLCMYEVALNRLEQLTDETQAGAR